MRTTTEEGIQATKSGAARGVRAWLAKDWSGQRHIVWAGALLALTVLVTTLYYAARPAVEMDPDTWAYLATAARIKSHLLLVAPDRLPGYPLFLLLVFALAGPGNLVAAGVGQAVLFVIAVMELYTLLSLIFRRGWLAFVPAAIVGTNPQALAHVKPMLTEALALFLLTTLALVATLYLRTWRARWLWVLALVFIALVMTRPEWIYAPPLVLGLLAWYGVRRAGADRRHPQRLRSDQRCDQ